MARRNGSRLQRMEESIFSTKAERASTRSNWIKSITSEHHGVPSFTLFRPSPWLRARRAYKLAERIQSVPRSPSLGGRMPKEHGDDKARYDTRWAPEGLYHRRRNINGIASHFRQSGLSVFQSGRHLSPRASDFAARADKKDFLERGDDVITTISQPYLQFSIMN